MKYAFIRARRAEHSVRKLCRLLDVSEQGYYAYLKAPESPRRREDRFIGDRVQMIFGEHRKRLGSPRIREELKDEGIFCGKKRVARLMKERHLRAKAARKYVATTDSNHSEPVAANTLNRQFQVTAPNQVWVGDITYLWTDEGWMYLAVFLDLFSRKVVGWALSRDLRGTVVNLAFERACASRRPPSGLLIHTDRGTQYAADAFRKLLRANDCNLSMSRRGNCWDNAVAESFFHTLKVEAIHGEPTFSRPGLEFEVFDYIERYYNRRRKHSSIDYCSPESYERIYHNNREALAA